MSEALVNVKIDGIPVEVPKGTLIVDAAKKVGIAIPVFCYHPKMKPVGMCRMCLVEVGRPQRDRATGKPVLDEQGRPVVQFTGKLETACTTPVEEGWEIRVDSPAAKEGRKQVVEFLLTSHPLDCPVCDKGGECPLQNQTMSQGPGTSRFLYDDKQHLAKKMPLGELIILDRERCIQCARCVRFQEEIADDPVIGFFERGRKLEIVTFSEPGFDSYFSGNTTDVCPVGALTTTDFRFGARPWELNAAASICPHCAVGCNLTLNTRREAKAGGREVVKRVMPRQNEAVNELWICDKGRFAHHFASETRRLTRPMVRRGKDLVEVSWDEALARAAGGLKAAGGKLVGLAGGRAANEDLFTFRKLVEGLGGSAFLDSDMAGGDWVQKAGPGTQANLGHLGQGDAILVVATDLHEEAPLWWLRVKQAAERGASLVVANGRETRLDRYATHVIRYPFADAEAKFIELLNAVRPGAERAKPSADEATRTAATVLADAKHLVVFFGQEGLDVAGTETVAQIGASLLAATGHAGKEDCGLIAVWPKGNLQGAWDMGLKPDPERLRGMLPSAKALLVMAADPLGDETFLASLVPTGCFVVVQELALTATAQRADVVFPAQSFLEREGSYTSGERRVQRFFPAIAAQGQTRPDFEILAEVAKGCGVSLPSASAAAIMQAIAAEIRDYASVSYQSLSAVEPQWPLVGGDDLYLGGTAYKNVQGLGISLPSAAERGETVEVQLHEPARRLAATSLLLVPVTKLYDRGTTMTPSTLLAKRSAGAILSLHPEDAGRLGLIDGGHARVEISGRAFDVLVKVTGAVPRGVVLLPRSVGVPVQDPVAVEIAPVRAEVAR